ncbi:LAME_0F01926g1_1 [Lachancea meyersii CBS 8951]|uniref:LAME_0F01926g1_1 n=1 Tax=Lachancea meyersii CBS 8951 TaxID=1266667 RepID=A0A1G4JQ31_9SACH|nr:LAME_0F01926g1_1 [Lachancea meyersii CBS 8951]
MPIQLWGKDQIKVVYERVAGNDRFPFQTDPYEDDHYRRSGLPGPYQRTIKWTNRQFSRLSKFTILRIDLVHWSMLLILLASLAKFSTKYSQMYAHSALLTTIYINGLLFGISDTLAQCIRQNRFRTPAYLPLGGGFSSDQNVDDLGLDDSISIFNDYGPVPTTASHEGPVASEASNHFDLYRWACFTAWGSGLAFFQVPWYRILNYFYTEDPSVVQTLERVLSDQLVYSPISLVCFFMYSNYVMERGDSSTFKTKIEKIYLGTLGFNYMLWPPVQFINFMLMPKHFQVPFSSSVGVLWNCFLSMRNASNSVQKT